MSLYYPKGTYEGLISLNESYSLCISSGTGIGTSSSVLSDEIDVYARLLLLKSGYGLPLWRCD